jgi:hypothetical protein
MTTNIILIAIASIALFTVYYFHRPLLIWLTGKIYGKYSFHYLQMSRRFYGNVPFPHGINTELTEHIENLSIRMKELDIVPTGSELVFSDIKFGSSIKELIGMRNFPKYFNGKKSKGKEIVYAGYERVIAGKKINELYFFMNGKYFMGEYWFEYYSNGLAPNFFKSFYNLNGLSISNKREYKLFCNESRNNIARLYEDNGFSVSVKYFNTTSMKKLGLI